MNQNVALGGVIQLRFLGLCIMTENINKDRQSNEVKSANAFGGTLRAQRKKQKLTLSDVSNFSRLSIRFLSELERGKKTAELGKALEAVKLMGLEIIIQPRGTQQLLLRQARLQQTEKKK